MSAAWGAAEAGDETSGLSGRDELLRVELGQGCQAELGRADQLRERAARPEGDKGPEQRVLDDAGEQLGAVLEERLDDDRRPDPLDGGPNLLLVAKVERDAADVGLVHARRRRS